jgi:predicted aspartyl protease
MVKAKMKNFIDDRRGKGVEKEALVDTGATMRTLPEEIVEGSRLIRSGFVTASYVDGSKKRRKIGSGNIIEIMGIEALVDCVIERWIF